MGPADDYYGEADGVAGDLARLAASPTTEESE
jgi:hypothetical protein